MVSRPRLGLLHPPDTPTLLATLACAHQPSEGTLEILGQDPWHLPHAARHRLRARLFLAPQTPPLPARQRVVTAVLAARLPHWTLWQALKSLVRPHDHREHLQGLAQPHVVGQHPAEPGVPEQREPPEPVDLVGPQRRVQTVGDVSRLHRVEV